jgi:formylglycine-generating enzyme required for sulfatase activity
MKKRLGWIVTSVVVVMLTGCGTKPRMESHKFDDANRSPAKTLVATPPTAADRSSLSPQRLVKLNEDSSLAMVLIPAGSFMMGDDAGLDDEKPAHKVLISRPFYLGQHEVTVDQFRQFVTATGYVTDAEKGTGFLGAFGWDREAMEFQMNPEYSWRQTGFGQAGNHPVVNVSWNDASAFCGWLREMEGQDFRLPTEAEWEYACRAGTETSYCSGDDPEVVTQVGNIPDASFARQFPELESAVQADDGYAYTAPAGSFVRNPFGLYDMHGNVWEWCQDPFDVEYYANSPSHDPPGPATGEERVYRGGGWFNCARGFRSSSRSGDVPENRHLTLGFRIALTAE